jgi:hypothetical protein
VYSIAQKGIASTGTTGSFGVEHPDNIAGINPATTI